jgi:hypothetical protein
LQQHLWEHRVVLLLSPDKEEPAFRQQIGLWTATPEEVTDRDLVLYQLFQHSGTEPGGTPLQPEVLKRLTNRYGPVPEQGLKFVLIGKDGTVKMEREVVVPMQELFGRIDQMPMRRAEMRRRKN